MHEDAQHTQLIKQFLLADVAEWIHKETSSTGMFLFHVAEFSIKFQP